MCKKCAKVCKTPENEKSREESCDSSWDFGALEGTRIPGPLIKSQMLYRLSYERIFSDLQILPNYIVGDFDSVKKEIGDYYRNETNVPIREFNPVKDASDTEIAIRLAMTLGAKEILILGATGGRIDHLWANVQSLAIPFKAGIDAVIMDTQNKIRLIGGGETHLKKGETYGPYFSVFPLGEEVYGFSIKGAKYPLDNHTLIPYDSLCVSNQFQEDEVTISFMKGIVILMETKDR